MIKIAVYDSNQAKLDELRNFIENDLNEDGIEFTTIYFTDSKALWNYLSGNNSIDIILLDLCHQYQRGIQLVNDIEKTYPHIGLLFFSKQLGALNFASRTLVDSANHITDNDSKYILSIPLSINDLRMSLVSTVKLFEYQERNKITVRSRGQIYSLRLNFIDYIVSSSRQIIFHGCGKELPVYGKLDEIEEKLGPSFLRCHQSYLVNISRIAVFDKHGIQLRSGAKIPVSKARHAKAYADFLKLTDGNFNFPHSEEGA
ncbi:hypothetical protein SDC9_42737 [bioreactor metagenome]|uniref:HTH LytTR-type domain-containing protein n=1 Tax=bioreactor metagenome TaxID=1076179 RepID=A0A644VYK0_9ZZZZ